MVRRDWSGTGVSAAPRSSLEFQSRSPRRLIINCREGERANGGVAVEAPFNFHLSLGLPPCSTVRHSALQFASFWLEHSKSAAARAQRAARRADDDDRYDDIAE